MVKMLTFIERNRCAAASGGQGYAFAECAC
jgi:hypothetical protein